MACREREGVRPLGRGPGGRASSRPLDISRSSVRGYEEPLSSSPRPGRPEQDAVLFRRQDEAGARRICARSGGGPASGRPSRSASTAASAFQAFRSSASAGTDASRAPGETGACPPGAVPGRGRVGQRNRPARARALLDDGGDVLRIVERVGVELPRLGDGPGRSRGAGGFEDVLALDEAAGAVLRQSIGRLRAGEWFPSARTGLPFAAAIP